MEKLGLEHFQQSTQNQKIYDFDIDSPDYKTPTPEESRANLLLNYLGVTDLNNTFDKMRHPAGFEQTYQAFKEISTGSEWYMLLVYGGKGNGKTKCCQATVISLYDQGIKVKRNRWSDIVRHLKSLMGTPDYETYFNEFRERKWLILDDVGSGSTLGTWEWGELEDIVDYRLEKRLATIVTTNLDTKDIPERIISRFRDRTKARLILNKAADYRPILAKE